MDKDFETYLQQARTEFCLVAHRYNVREHNELRTAIDSLLIAYDQAFLALRKHSVGGPASASALEGEQLGNEGLAKSVCGGVRNCNGNGIDNGLGYCIYCEEKIPRA
jgi:hypothetical protein